MASDSNDAALAAGVPSLPSKVVAEYPNKAVRLSGASTDPSFDGNSTAAGVPPQPEPLSDFRMGPDHSPAAEAARSQRILAELLKSETACDNYTRPAGIMGGPCVNCGLSQPEHTNGQLEHQHSGRREPSQSGQPDGREQAGGEVREGTEGRGAPHRDGDVHVRREKQPDGSEAGSLVAGVPPQPERPPNVNHWVERLEAEMFPHQESEEEQESFTLVGRKRVEKVLAEMLKVEHTRAILCYTAKGYAAGENTDAKHWRKRAEEAEAKLAGVLPEREPKEQS